MEKKLINTVIFGGAFDPFHFGHVYILEQLMLKDFVEKVLIIPNFNPPHKKTLLSGELRLEMCQLVLADLPNRSRNPILYEISDLECKASGPSYTIDTLKKLKQRYVKDFFYLVMGSDNFDVFDTWKDYKKILKMAKLIVISRDERPISSTQVRDLIKVRKDFSEFVPKKVYDYILSKGLYNSPSAPFLRREGGKK